MRKDALNSLMTIEAKERRKEFPVEMMSNSRQNKVSQAW